VSPCSHKCHTRHKDNETTTGHNMLYIKTPQKRDIFNQMILTICLKEDYTFLCHVYCTSISVIYSLKKHLIFSYSCTIILFLHILHVHLFLRFLKTIPYTINHCYAWLRLCYLHTHRFAVMHIRVQKAIGGTIFYNVAMFR
jgi:hypothetical protein